MLYHYYTANHNYSQNADKEQLWTYERDNRNPQYYHHRIRNNMAGKSNRRHWQVTLVPYEHRSRVLNRYRFWVVGTVTIKKKKKMYCISLCCRVDHQNSAKTIDKTSRRQGVQPFGSREYCPTRWPLRRRLYVFPPSSLPEWRVRVSVKPSHYILITSVAPRLFVITVADRSRAGITIPLFSPVGNHPPELRLRESFIYHINVLMFKMAREL